MPEVTKTSSVPKKKIQPWRAVWPAPEAAGNPQLWKKAACPGHGGVGSYGYNDKNEGIPGSAPKNWSEDTQDLTRNMRGDTRRTDYRLDTLVGHSCIR